MNTQKDMNLGGRRWLLGLTLLMWIPVGLHSQPANKLDPYLNKRIAFLVEQRVKTQMPAEIDQTSLGRQTQTPSGSGNSTSLVDQTAVADLFGFAFNLGRFSQGVSDSASKNSAVVTVTPYALYSAAMGVNPLNPEFYGKHSVLRRFSFGYGFDEPANNSGQPPLRLYTFKVVFLNGRDPSADENQVLLGNVTNALQNGGTEYSRITEKVGDFLYHRLGQGKKEMDFLNSLTEAEIVAHEAEIDRIIVEHIEAFCVLDAEVSRVVSEIQSKPQVSLSGSLKESESKTVYGSLAFLAEFGLGTKTEFVANAAYEESRIDSGGPRSGGKAGFEFNFLPAKEEGISFRQPLSLSVAASGQWMKGTLPVYQFQLKAGLPVAWGMVVPIALTWKQGSLIAEGDFVAQVGFAFDFARLLTGRQ